MTGSEGQLGQCFKTVEKDFPFHKLFFANKNILDITKIECLEKIYKKYSFEGIINCAAYTNVNKAEFDIDKAIEINEIALKKLTTFAEQKELFIIHFSTDYIFDGKYKKPLKEKHSPNPPNIYAKTKLAGEKVLLNSNCIQTTFRLSWLFSPFGKNFVKTILNLSRYKKEIKVVNDQSGRPTYGIDLARLILGKLELPNFFDYKCYHFANKGITTWFDFAKKIIDLSNINCIVYPCSTIENPTSAVRPEYSVLNTRRIEEHFSLHPSNWEDALKRCLKRIQLNEFS